MSISGEVLIASLVSLIVGLSANWAKVAVQKIASQPNTKGVESLEAELRELKREANSLRRENTELKNEKMLLEFKVQTLDRELLKAE